jgi:hypothetical protein
VSPVTILSDGRKATYSPTVDLNLTSADAGSSVDKISVFNENVKGTTATATNATYWRNASSTISTWQLSPNDGNKTVYLVIRDAWGNTSAIPTN